MKQIFAFALALLVSLSSYAQHLPGGTTNAGGGGGGGPVVYVPNEETPWSHVVDSMLYYVDKSQIPSGILYDRVVPYAALPYFDLFQADTTSAAHMRQAYLELFISAYNQQFSLKPTQFRENADLLTRQGAVPLAVLDYRLHYLDTMAVYNNQLVLQNGLYHDVAGRSSSPYLERLLTLAAPMAESITQQAQFQVSPALLLGNRGRVVSSLLVDFDNGAAPVTCVPGQTVSVSYPSPGKKVVRITVTFTNGTSAQSRARLTVLPQPPASRTIFRLTDIEARDAFQDYDSARRLYGKGEVLVVLNNSISESEGAAYKLRNPVIVMDGFDPNDESPLEGDFNGNKSIYTLLAETHILDLLTATQRDLVILNFPKSQRRIVGGGITAEAIDGGTDYVERNAYVLEKLLNDLKGMTHRDPTSGLLDKFAVIGPSMGGLVSRYALAHMEQQHVLFPNDTWWDHNTAEWISFDTPHMGANIPLADQYLLNFFRDKEAARTNLDQRLNAVAAKQFLVAHYTYTGPNVGGAPGFRDRFMRALRDNGEQGSYGYPVHLRRVALADGKLNGQLPPNGDGTPCGVALELNAYTRFWSGVGVTLIGFFGLTYNTTSPTTIARCQNRFLPAPNNTCYIFSASTSEAKGLSWGRVGAVAFQNIIVQGGAQGSWDLAPGGLRTTQQQLHDQLEGAGQGKEYKISVTEVHPNHCFIPTVSALGFQYQSVSNYQNTSSLPNPFTNLLTRGDLVCNNEIPFDDFYAPATANYSHVTVPSTDAGMLAFLIRELTPQVATPVFTAAPPAICPGGTATFSVRDCAPRTGQPTTTYTWTPGPGLTIQSGQGTATVTVQSTPGFAGPTYVSVVATRLGYASSTQASASSFVDQSFLEINNGVSSPMCATSGLVYNITASFGVPAGAVYTWTTSDGYLSSQNGGTSMLIDGLTFRDYKLTVTVSCPSPCPGAPDVRGVYEQEFYTSGCPFYRTVQPGTPAPVATLYPNPATSSVDVHVDNADTARPVTVRLFDSYGRACTEQTSHGETTLRLATDKLPAGLYFVHILRGNEVLKREQLRIEK